MGVSLSLSLKSINAKFKKQIHWPEKISQCLRFYEESSGIIFRAEGLLGYKLTV